MTDYDKVRRSPYYFKPPKRESREPRRPRQPRKPRGPRASDSMFEEFVFTLESYGLFPKRLPGKKQGGAVVRFQVNGKTCVGHRIKKAFFPRENGAGYYRGEIARGQDPLEIHLFLVGEGATSELYVLPYTPGKHHFPHVPGPRSRFEEFRLNLSLLT